VTDTTLDEARRCPKCQEQGMFVASRPAHGARPGTKLDSFRCDNERCKWYGEICRIIQINPDGSIPQAIMKRDKQFPAVPDRTERVNEQLAAQLKAQLAKEGTPELRRE
jgi:hypothetical protein